MSSLSLFPCIGGDKGAAVVATGTVLTLTASVLTGLRIYTRARLVSAGFGWDDVTIILAMVSKEGLLKEAY